MVNPNTNHRNANKVGSVKKLQYQLQEEKQRRAKLEQEVRSLKD